MYGLMRAKNGHPDITFRYIIGPQREMPNKIVPLILTRQEVETQLALGRQDATEYVKIMKENEIKRQKGAWDEDTTEQPIEGPAYAHLYDDKT